MLNLHKLVKKYQMWATCREGHWVDRKITFELA